DNGAFYFLRRAGAVDYAAYEEFVARARPDWYPIAQDFIPAPHQSEAEQQNCFDRTMAQNLAYARDGFVPVIHISRLLDRYTIALQSSAALAKKQRLALGGIVPNLLRAPKAMPYREILDSLKKVRQTFANREIHVFGMGGTATMHLAALLDIDSADSSGWRNRAARGIIQLPGHGDRVIADMGSWRGRRLDANELQLLKACECPSCQRLGIDGLGWIGVEGFCNRVTQNRWVLHNEFAAIETHSKANTCLDRYQTHLTKSIYVPLIKQVIKQ